MVDRLLRLVITLLVSIASTERGFLAVKLTKTRMLHYLVICVMIEFIRQYIWHVWLYMCLLNFADTWRPRPMMPWWCLGGSPPPYIWIMAPPCNNAPSRSRRGNYSVYVDGSRAQNFYFLWSLSLFLINLFWGPWFTSTPGELGSGGALMALALGFFRSESERAKGTEGDGDREVSEPDGLVATQGWVWPWPWGRRRHIDTTGRPRGGQSLGR
jgi:hypothetical protein